MKRKPEGHGFFIETLVPIILYILWMPRLAGPIWQNVYSDPSTTLWTLLGMHALSIMIGICWLQCYNCLLWGLFPPKRRR